MKKNTDGLVWFNEPQLGSLDPRRRFIAYLRLAQSFPQCQWLWQMQLDADRPAGRWTPWPRDWRPSANAPLATPNWTAILAAPDRPQALQECLDRAPQVCTARADATIASSVSEHGRYLAARQLRLSYTYVDARLAAHRSRTHIR